MNAATATATTLTAPATAPKLTGKEMLVLRAYVDSLLNTRADAVERAMVVLYDRQTSDEKVISSTKYHNNRGFAHNAAKAGSFFARLVLGKRELYADNLVRARGIALKHSMQLAENLVMRQGVEKARAIIASYSSTAATA